MKVRPGDVSSARSCSSLPGHLSGAAASLLCLAFLESCSGSMTQKGLIVTSARPSGLAETADLWRKVADAAVTQAVSARAGSFGSVGRHSMQLLLPETGAGRALAQGAQQSGVAAGHGGHW